MQFRWSMSLFVLQPYFSDSIVFASAPEPCQTILLLPQIVCTHGLECNYWAYKSPVRWMLDMFVEQKVSGKAKLQAIHFVIRDKGGASVTGWCAASVSKLAPRCFPCPAYCWSE